MQTKAFLAYIKSKDLNYKLEGCEKVMTALNSGEIFSKIEANQALRLFLSAISRKTKNDQIPTICLFVKLFNSFLLLENNHVKKQTPRVLKFLEKRILLLNDPPKILAQLDKTIATLIKINGSNAIMNYIINWLNNEKEVMRSLVLNSFLFSIQTDYENFVYLKYFENIVLYLSGFSKNLQKQFSIILSEVYKKSGRKFLKEIEPFRNNETLDNFFKQLDLKKTNKTLENNPIIKPNRIFQTPKNLRRKTQTIPKSTSKKIHTNTNSNNWRLISQKIEPTIAATERELQNHLNRLQYILENNDKSDQWENRIGAMIKLESLLNGGAYKCKQFPDLLKPLLNSLTEQLTDPRSQVIKQCCYLIAHFSRKLGIKFKDHFLYLFNSLLALVPVTIQIISETSDLCLRELIIHTPTSRIIPKLTFHYDSKNKIQRTRCIEYLLLILQNWKINQFSNHTNSLFQIISKSLHDADSETRKISRSLLWEFKLHFPELGQNLIHNQDSKTLKHIITQNTPSNKYKSKNHRSKTLHIVEYHQNSIKKTHNANEQKQKTKQKRSYSLVPKKREQFTEDFYSNTLLNRNGNNNLSVNKKLNQNQSSQSISHQNTNIPKLNIYKSNKDQKYKNQNSNKSQKKKGCKKKLQFEPDNFLGKPSIVSKSRQSRKKTIKTHNQNLIKKSTKRVITAKDPLKKKPINNCLFSISDNFNKEDEMNFTIHTEKESTIIHKTNERKRKKKKKLKKKVSAKVNFENKENESQNDKELKPTILKPKNVLENSNKTLELKSENKRQSTFFANLKNQKKQLLTTTTNVKTIIFELFTNLDDEENRDLSFQMISKLSLEETQSFWETHLLTIINQLINFLHNPDQRICEHSMLILRLLINNQGDHFNFFTKKIIHGFISSFEEKDARSLTTLFPILNWLLPVLNNKEIVFELMKFINNNDPLVLQITLMSFQLLCTSIKPTDLKLLLPTLLNRLKVLIKNSNSNIRKESILFLVGLKNLFGKFFENKLLESNFSSSELKLIQIYQNRNNYLF
ncbi:clip-associating protein [Anaeramoeba flamelloides]|uniref:Clip-associating protein n=1 Tax=Anaeramoeba flamelloides TaxID=1746091 RepID=A0AAV7Z1R6_9EUKA|nr:clip-associating protein [Anaeramoeba flamelloides]